MGQTASAHLTGVGAQLIKASKAGDADAVMELVSRHPQLVRYSTFRQLGPCHYAARGDHVDVLQLLVAKAEELERMREQHVQEQAAAAARASEGAGRHAQQQQQQQQQQQPSLVHQLVNATSDRGLTPLMLAVTGGCAASVRLLLDKGADAWAVDKLGGRTALHYAARSGDVEIVQLLVAAAGSSGPVRFPNRPNTKYVDVRTQTGFTAIHFAVHAGSQQALAVLLDCGANPLLSSLFDCLDTINCSRGTTALHLAARYGSEALAKQLLKAYMEQWYHRHLPDPRLLMDGDSQLPCQVAARRQHRAVARMLLPSAPLASLFAEGELDVLGPPSLSAIAGAVLRSTLAGDLQHVVQQGQEQEHAGGAQQEEQEQQEEAGDDAARAASEEQEEDACAAAADAAALDARVVRPCGAGDSKHDCSAAPHAPPQPAAAAAAAAEPPTAASYAASEAAASSASLDAVCGVCFDAEPQVTLAPCGHELCVDCCQHMLELNSRCVMICPFCRAGVAHLQPCAHVAAALGGGPLAAPPAPQPLAARGGLAAPALVV